MSATEETLKLLTRIAAATERCAAALEKLVAAKPEVAPESDLDSQYGNEKIRLDPRNWKGQSFKGRLMSDAVPEFLDQLADAYAYLAGKEQDQKKAKYGRISAARALGWAKRLRSGWKPPKVEKKPEPEKAKESTEEVDPVQDFW